MSLLRMRCYGDDREHSSLRAVIPEDPVGSWCFLLDIRLEDLFPVRPFEGTKFMCVQRRMVEVGFEKPQAFSDGFKGIFLKGSGVKSLSLTLDSTEGIGPSNLTERTSRGNKRKKVSRRLFYKFVRDGVLWQRS